MTQRLSPTEQHKNAWLKFDKILRYRANLSMGYLFIMNMIWIVSGRMHYDLSLKFMDSEETYNEDLTTSIFPYIKAAQIVLTLGRLVIVILAYKWHSLSRYFLYYDVVFFMVFQCLPLDYGEIHLNYVFYKNFCISMMFQTDYKKNVAALVAGQLFVGIVVRKFIYLDEINEELLIFNLGWLINLVFLTASFHVIINRIGSIFVAAELPGLGKHDLLNDLKEGILVIE